MRIFFCHVISAIISQNCGSYNKYHYANIGEKIYMLFQAVICMNIALIFYTLAVFSARRGGLQRKHLLIFGFGLLSDYLGTHLMLLYGTANYIVPKWHTAIGIASLIGMAFHFMLALVATLVRRAESVNRLFHRVSLTIYTCWLISFFSGMIAGISGK
jgi:uncharacterized repeat protein (TIGR03987 family)